MFSQVTTCYMVGNDAFHYHFRHEHPRELDMIKSRCRWHHRDTILPLPYSHLYIASHGTRGTHGVIVAPLLPLVHGELSLPQGRQVPHTVDLPVLHDTGLSWDSPARCRVTPHLNVQHGLAHHHLLQGPLAPHLLHHQASVRHSGPASVYKQHLGR